MQQCYAQNVPVILTGVDYEAAQKMQTWSQGQGMCNYPHQQLVYASPVTQGNSNMLYLPSTFAEAYTQMSQVPPTTKSHSHMQSGMAPAQLQSGMSNLAVGPSPIHQVYNNQTYITNVTGPLR